ncbi:MAG: hypothetical protein KC486_01000 [Myxococcales bacterium]|nr:hypothetical protein [Myxococcales bacterium]
MKAAFQWFRSPRFADAERTRVAHLLNVLLLVALLFLCVVFAIRVTLLGLVGHWFVYPIFTGLMWTLLVTLRRGHVYASGVVFGATMLTYGFLGALATGGLRSPTIQVFMLVILVGAVLGRTYWVLGATALCLALTTGLAAIQFRGALPEVAVPLTPGSIFSGQLLATLMIGGAAALIIASLQEARRRAEAKERALAASLGALEATQAELVAHRDALEERVADRTADLEVKNERLEAAIAELGRTQTQLVRSEKMASLGLLVSGIAHELKNPLNFVNNFAELALDFLAEHRGSSGAADLLEEVDENLRRILHHGQRADRIINAMLLHARERREATRVAINVFVSEHARLAYQGFRSATNDLELTATERFDPSVGELRIVAEDLSAALINLVTNACQSMRQRALADDPDYSPTLVLSTRSDPDSVAILIEDNGVGMTAEVRSRVFDPFFTTKPPGEGTGLGLSLTYEAIVTGLGGTIDVVSQPDQGATFTIRLPVNADRGAGPSASA